MASSFGFTATKEGTVDFKRDGETYQTFYKVFGDLASAKAPLIVLHGGPGLTHDYLLPISDLATSHSIPIVFYDQIGNGRSTHLKEKEPTFWTVDLFIEELLNLLSQLKIESYDILGHSWGGILASEFEVRRKPAGLRHLVISDSLAASALWGKATGELLGGFPKEVAEGMGAGMKDPAKFIAALKTFQAKHVCTVKPVPEPLTYSLDQIFGPNGDPTVAGAPILKDWTIVDRLHQVRVMSLVINGTNEQAQDYVIAPFFTNIPKVKWVKFAQATHVPFWEERERYMQVVADFLAL